MSFRHGSLALFATGLFWFTAHARDAVNDSPQYQALECPQPKAGSTWAILDRDGANQPVAPYLSSLGQGESGTGSILSPPFSVAVDAITFTICGHDGAGGGRGENYIALVDAKTGEILRRTEAPGHDALQQRRWDVAELKGAEVRIEVHDGNQEGAFAWLGIGGVDAGPALRVDFRQGLPEGWVRPERETEPRWELVGGGVPFRRNAALPGLIPEKGDVEIPCGFAPRRVFLLGCTVPLGEPLAYYGAVEFTINRRPWRFFR
jgi:hypothetical protein